MGITVALENIRSSHNVGSILRSAYAFNVDEVVTIGITPHLRTVHDERLPHVIEKSTKAIAKTALGGESLLSEHFLTTTDFLAWHAERVAELAIVEISETSIDVRDYQRPESVTLVVGHEVDGVSAEMCAAADALLEIPMPGSKESLNVGVAASIAMFELL